MCVSLRGNSIKCTEKSTCNIHYVCVFYKICKGTRCVSTELKLFAVAAAASASFDDDRVKEKEKVFFYRKNLKSGRKKDVL